MKQYRLLKDIDTPWVKVTKGTIVRQDYNTFIGDAHFIYESDYLKDITFTIKDVSNTEWFEEIIPEVKEFTKSDLLKFARYFHFLRDDMTIETVFDQWLELNKP